MNFRLWNNSRYVISVKLFLLAIKSSTLRPKYDRNAKKFKFGKFVQKLLYMKVLTLHMC